ncbi:MAG TPA: valine--tRNA ligase, partial [Aliiroseovarius sp.]|nr:valine--tRNA ligase [Aliiroseovarius sp.]
TVFVDMYEKGLIHRGKRLVNWDPHFETAISDLEVENREVDGHMWHFKYPLAGGETYEYLEKDESGNVIFRETRDYISIATTRPETMLGDGAVAVHPDDERYAPIVGKLCEIPVGPKEHRRLIPIITDEYPDPDFGSGAVKITGAHDFNDYQVARRNHIPMYRLMDTRAHMRSDGAPYAEAAARAQEIAGGAEFTEAEVDALNLVPDELRGLDRFEARAKVVAQITDEGLAVMTTDADGNPVPLVENKPIMQPFGDRSGVVIEPMLTDQWFVDTAKIVGPALDAVRQGRVTIMPESGEKVFYHWLDNIEPWCISRQLWWGHRIPVWYAMVPSKDGHIGTWKAGALENMSPSEVARFEREHKFEEKALGGNLTDGGILVQEFCATSAEEAKQQIARVWQERTGSVPGKLVEVDSEPHNWPLGSEEWPNRSGVEDGYFKIPFWRDPDVLDTWFSSGLWPFGTLGWPHWTDETRKYFPTDVLITGQDILFFWVARMMMMSQAVLGQDPFHTVYLHQLVRDEKGAKMSKTKGNVIDPLEIVDEFGADALRFTMAQMAAIGGVLKLSTDRIKGYRNFGTKLWNAARFAEMNAALGSDGTLPTPTATANKWIIGEVARLRETVDAALEALRFNDAANALYAFTWGKLCDWYLEFSKPLLGSDDAAIAAETRATMAWAMDQTLTMLHPIMPFITEEIWGLSGDRPNMLIHQDWPEYTTDQLLDPEADREMNWTISLIEAIRSARAQMHVPAGLKIPVILRDLDDAGRCALSDNEALVKRLARIDSITEMPDLPKGSVVIPVAGGTFALPLADIIDVDAEKARLAKSLEKLEKEIRGLAGRVNNPKFVASAPEAVVAETRANLALREDEAGKLREALNRLEELG